MSCAPSVNSYSQRIARVPGMGVLDFRHLDAREGGNVLKLYMKELHRLKGFDTEHTPPEDLRRLVGLENHTSVGISKMPDYVVMWKPARYEEHGYDDDAPIVMAIAHSEDINDDTINPTKHVSVHRLRYRDHDRTLRMLKNEDAQNKVRMLQDQGRLPPDMLLTPHKPYAAVIQELQERMRNDDLMGKNTREVSPRNVRSGSCGRRTPPSVMMPGHAGDMQSGGSESEGESMSSIDDVQPMGRSNAWTNAEAEFDCGSGSDRSSPVSFTSTEFMSDESECDEV